MASRNLNRPPCSLSNKKAVAGTGRARTPLYVVVNNAIANDAEGTDSSTLEFTKEEVEALLNEKIKKGNQCDNKTKIDQNLDLIMRLKLYVRALQSKVESAIKKCCDTVLNLAFDAVLNLAFAFYRLRTLMLWPSAIDQPWTDAAPAPIPAVNWGVPETDIGAGANGSSWSSVFLYLYIACLVLG